MRHLANAGGLGSLSPDQLIFSLYGSGGDPAVLELVGPWEIAEAASSQPPRALSDTAQAMSQENVEIVKTVGEAINRSEERRRRDLGYSPEMPRYHAIIRGTDLRPVKKAVSIKVKGLRRSERTADLRADSEAAAAALVTARLPKGGDAKVVEVREVKD